MRVCLKGTKQGPNSDNITSKGSFRSRKKIVKVLFPGVAVWGSCSVGEMRWGVVEVWGSCGVGKLQCTLA